METSKYKILNKNGFDFNNQNNNNQLPKEKEIRRIFIILKIQSFNLEF